MKNTLADEIRVTLDRLPAAYYFGYEDIRLQYKRTFLGPLWLIFGTCAYIFGFSFVMAGLFNVSITTFLPHTIIGMYVWTFLALSMTDGCTIFVNASQLIHAMRLPLLFHVARAGIRYLLLYAHYMAVAIVLMLIVGHHFTWIALLALPGIAITMVAALGGMLIFSTVNARYRDLMPLTVVICQLMPMLTPIAWRIDMLKKYQWIALMNPFYHLIEVVRAPLLGEIPTQTSYLVASATALFALMLGFVLFRRSRFHLIFWI